MPDESMLSDPVVKKAFPWCWILILIPCIGWFWCWAGCGSSSTSKTAAAEPNIILELEEVGAWMTFDNRFWDPGSEDPDSVYYWPGVLFQLGALSRADFEFQFVELRSDGDSVAAYGPTGDRTPFDWINVVCEYTSSSSGKHTDVPVGDTDLAFYLYPNEHVWNCCDAVVLAVLEEFGATCVSDTLDLQACLRNRKLTWSLTDVAAIMTFWPGSDGYRVEASQEGDETRSNRYEFFTDEKFRVEIYEEVDGSMTLTASYDPGDIDQIVVRAHPTPPTGGAKQSPPWPDGEYP